MKSTLKMTVIAEERTSIIIKTATQLFAERGYHATTMDEIAKNAGVSKASIYYYFNSKDEIIREIIKLGTSQMEKVLTIGKSTMPVREKLRQLIKHHIILSIETPDLAKVFFEQLDVLPKRTRESFVRKQDKVDIALQNILREGVEEGVLINQDLKILSCLIFSMCNMAYHWHKSYKAGGKLTPRQITDIATSLLENGYLQKP